MIVPDVNLLLYAYDTSSQFNERAKEWWEACLSGTETVGLTYPVIFGYLRIGTSKRVFLHPLTIDEAMNHIDSWRNRGIVRMLLPDHDHVTRVARLLREAGSEGGNLVGDAQIASIAQTNRAVVHTADYDFRRFPEVDTFFPLE